MKKQTTLYVIRHGTTALNQQYCFQGWLDEPLNELGLKQGSYLYDRFKDIPIDVAVSSPLSRARQTMELLLGDRDIPIIIEPGLKEIDGPAVDGLPFPVIDTMFPGLSEKLIATPGKIKMPDGESMADVEKRVAEVFTRLAKENPGKTIVATMHGIALMTWINHVQGTPAEDMKMIGGGNVAVYKFTIGARGKVTIDFLADDAHLPDEYKENYDWEAIRKTPERPIFIYYPKCTTCQKAKKFLDEHHVDYIPRNIVENRLWPAELEELMGRFDGKPRQFFNSSGKLYREMGLKDQIPNMGKYGMIALLCTDGMLVRRPLLITSKKVLVGFKEEQWEEVINA